MSEGLNASVDSPLRSARKKVLLLHSGALGDVILLARFGGAALANAELTLACRHSVAKLLAAVGAVDVGIDIESLPLGVLFGSGEAAMLSERLKQFDLVVSCFGYGDEKLPGKLSTLCRHAIFLPARPAANLCGHLLEIWSHLSALSLDFSAARQWRLSDSDRLQGQDLLRQSSGNNKSPVVIAHIGSGSMEKCWPLEYWLSLKDMIDARVVFVCGEVERHRFTAESLDSLRNRATLLDEVTLIQLAGLLSSCDLYIGADSGPAHLAASLGVKTIAMFGPSNAEYFSPLMSDGTPAHIIKSVTGRMADINASDVATAVNNMLGGLGYFER